MRQAKLQPINSLNELYQLAGQHTQYQKLAMIAASNLGGSPTDLASAMRWLNINADETSEEGVVDEVNFCLDLV